MDELKNKEPKFQCTGDCIRCHPTQRQYCSAQNTYNTMRMVEVISATVSTMQNIVVSLQEMVSAIQGNEASVFSITQPELEAEVKEEAQKGSGA